MVGVGAVLGVGESTVCGALGRDEGVGYLDSAEHGGHEVGVALPVEVRRCGLEAAGHVDVRGPVALFVTDGDCHHVVVGRHVVGGEARCLVVHVDDLQAHVDGHRCRLGGAAVQDVSLGVGGVRGRGDFGVDEVDGVGEQ